MHGFCLLARAMLPGLELRADLICERIPHQFADKMDLPAPAFAAGGALSKANRLVQTFGQGKLLESFR